MRKKKAPKPLTPEVVLSRQWHGFNRGLSKLTEDQLKEALDLELDGKNRKSYVERIHTRFNSLRMEREKHELMEKVEKGAVEV